MEYIILTIALITTLPSHYIALVIQQVVDSTCSPNVAVIHINGSATSLMTTVIFRNPGDQTIGLAYLSEESDDATWKAKSAYTSRTSFTSAHNSQNIYIFQLSGLTGMDTGLYNVDVKHGGLGNTDSNVFIGKFKVSELEPTFYYDDHVIQTNSHLNVTYGAPIVFHTGRSLLADLYINVDQHNPVVRRNATQYTINIPQNWEAGMHNLTIFYSIRYKEQCANVTGNMSIYVTIREPSPPEKVHQSSKNGWMISACVLVAAVMILVISIVVICSKYKRIPYKQSPEHGSREINDGSRESRRPTHPVDDGTTGVGQRCDEPGQPAVATGQTADIIARVDNTSFNGATGDEVDTVGQRCDEPGQPAVATGQTADIIARVDNTSFNGVTGDEVDTVGQRCDEPGQPAVATGQTADIIARVDNTSFNGVTGDEVDTGVGQRNDELGQPVVATGQTAGIIAREDNISFNGATGDKVDTADDERQKGVREMAREYEQQVEMQNVEIHSRQTLAEPTGQFKTSHDAPNSSELHPKADVKIGMDTSAETEIADELSNNEDAGSDDELLKIANDD